ncbi:MAG: outer membrane protein transport protein [Deltaproteobacteria bacterium]|nr:outer membrane protein transport protein [Deltaproteobacteria bacterium]
MRSAARAVVALGALVLVAAAASMPREAAAGGFTNPDFGIRKLGMFAVTARPDDVTAVYHNPAGLVLTEGTQLYHAQSWFLIDLKTRMYDSKGNLRPNHEISPDWSVGFIPFIGVSTDFGTRDWRLAFAIYAPNAYGAALPEDEPTRYHGTRVLFLASRATLAAAYRVDERFSLGVSLSIVPVFLKMRQYYNLDVNRNPDLRFEPRSVTKSGDMILDVFGWGVTWGADFGVLFRPIPSLRIGAAFATGSKVTLKGDASLDLPNGDSASSDLSTSMVIPFGLRGGINWEFARDFELGLDVYWWHYQVLQEQVVKFSPALGGLVSEQRSPKNYGNSWAWNVGLLYHVHPKVELMLGFQMDFTPIPTETYTLDNPSTDQKGVCGGVRWQITDKVRVGLAFVRNWFSLVDVQDSRSSPPANVKGHAANFEIGADVQWRL